MSQGNVPGGHSWPTTSVRPIRTRSRSARRCGRYDLAPAQGDRGLLTFRALQDACGGVSPTVLNDRLRELRESRLIELAGAAG